MLLFLLPSSSCGLPFNLFLLFAYWSDSVCPFLLQVAAKLLVNVVNGLLPPVNLLPSYKSIKKYFLQSACPINKVYICGHCHKHHPSPSSQQLAGYCYCGESLSDATLFLIFHLWDIIVNKMSDPVFSREIRWIIRSGCFINCSFAYFGFSFFFLLLIVLPFPVVFVHFFLFILVFVFPFLVSVLSSWSCSWYYSSCSFSPEHQALERKVDSDHIVADPTLAPHFSKCKQFLTTSDPRCPHLILSAFIDGVNPFGKRPSIHFGHLSSPSWIFILISAF